jgi:hypothetical protein
VTSAWTRSNSARLELLAEYDETVARVEETERTIALLKAWGEQIGEADGDIERGLVKLMARGLDADELAVISAAIDGEIFSLQMNEGTCGNDPTNLWRGSQYHLQQALAKREALGD